MSRKLFLILVLLLGLAQAVFCQGQVCGSHCWWTVGDIAPSESININFTLGDEALPDLQIAENLEGEALESPEAPEEPEPGPYALAPVTIQADRFYSGSRPYFLSTDFLTLGLASNRSADIDQVCRTSYCTQTYLGVSAGNRQAMLDKTKQEGYNAMFIYTLNQSKYTDRVHVTITPYKHRFFGGEFDDAKIQRWRAELISLISNSIRPVLWLIPDDSPDATGASTGELKRYIGKMVESFDDLPVMWVLALEANEYWPDKSKSDELGRYLKSIAENPVGIHQTGGRVDYMTSDWVEFGVYQYRNEETWQGMYEETKEKKRAIGNKPFIAGEYYSQTLTGRDFKRLGLAAAFAGAAGVGDGAPPGLYDFMERLPDGMTTSSSGNKLYLQGSGVTAVADMGSLTFEISEGEEGLETIGVGTEEGGEYIVPLFSTMNIEGINTFSINCVDGAATGYTIPVRVMLKKPGEEEYTEVSNNAYNATGLTSCHSPCNPVVIGGSNRIANAYSFNEQGIYDVQLEYATKNDGSGWAAFKEFQVIVAGIDLNVFTLHEEEHIGFFISPDGTPIEDTKSKDIVWVIKNEGFIGVKLLDIKAVGCAEQELQCGFPDFDQENQPTIAAGEEYYLKERITASIPSKSSTDKPIGIDISATDEFGLSEEEIPANIVPVDQSITFSVLGRAVWSNPIEGTLTLSPGTYYAQVCVDSTVSDYLRPMVALDISYDAGEEGGTEDLRTVTANFHWVDDCSAPVFQGHGEATTDPFEIKKEQEITYRYYGDVGTEEIDPDTSQPYYQNNWARIGHDLNADTGYVVSPEGQDYNLDISLGRQEIKEVTDGPHTIDVNILEGVKKFGPYTPLPDAPTDGELGTTGYYLIDIELPDNTTVEGPTTRAEGGKATIFIHPINGEVSASSNAFEAGAEEASPVSTLVLLWLLKENFLVKIDAGKLGVCYGINDEVGFTGERVKPKIKFSWDWKDIDVNSCDAGTEQAIYCDATQFTIALIKRLERIRSLAEDENHEQIPALQQFDAYLIMDGYSPDFRSDFDSYMQTSGFMDTPAYYRNSWSKYFTDNSKMQFDIKGETGTVLPGPGKYSISLEFVFEEDNLWVFFSREEPAANIKVRLAKRRKPILDNPFYYLPFDGEIGISNGELKRDGYGIGFSGDNVKISMYGTDYLTTRNSDLTAVVSKVYVNNISDFDYAHKEKASRVLTISRRESATPFDLEFDLDYSPSHATPVIMQVASKEQAAEAFYRLKEGDSIIEGNEWMNSWTGIAETIEDEEDCVDYDGAKLFYKRRDEQASTMMTCAASELDKDKTYGFRWDTTKQGDIYLQGIFFTPLDKTIELVNACPMKGKFLSPAAPTGATSFELKENADYVDSVKTMVDSIETQMVCMTWNNDKAELWWNWNKIINEFKDSDSFSEEHPIHANECNIALAIREE